MVETILWGEKKETKIRAVQMNNLRGLLRIWGTDRVLNTRIRKLCGLMKGVDERLVKVLSDGSAPLK